MKELVEKILAFIKEHNTQLCWYYSSENIHNGEFHHQITLLRPNQRGTEDISFTNFPKKEFAKFMKIFDEVDESIQDCITLDKGVFFCSLDFSLSFGKSENTPSITNLVDFIEKYKLQIHQSTLEEFLTSLARTASNAKRQWACANAVAKICEKTSLQS